MTGIQFQVMRERICPGKARRILRTVGSSYRLVHPGEVWRFAEAMRGGQWRATLDAEISIDPELGLINGRRRLMAVIEADMSVDFIVRRGSFG